MQPNIPILVSNVSFFDIRRRVSLGRHRKYKLRSLKSVPTTTNEQRQLERIPNPEENVSVVAEHSIKAD